MDQDLGLGRFQKPWLDASRDACCRSEGDFQVFGQREAGAEAAAEAPVLQLSFASCKLPACLLNPRLLRSLSCSELFRPHLCLSHAWSKEALFILQRSLLVLVEENRLQTTELPRQALELLPFASCVLPLVSALVLAGI